MEKIELIQNAKLAAEKAYAPYSGCKVGAAILTKEHKIITGCNVENASYGLTICAERNAIASAINQGYHHFIAIAVYVDMDYIFTPCGACRQVISEFCDDIPIYLASRSDSLDTTSAALLPLSFKMEK